MYTRIVDIFNMRKYIYTNTYINDEKCELNLTLFLFISVFLLFCCLIGIVVLGPFWVCRDILFSSSMCQEILLIIIIIIRQRNMHYAFTL